MACGKAIPSIKIKSLAVGRESFLEMVGSGKPEVPFGCSCRLQQHSQLCCALWFLSALSFPRQFSPGSCCVGNAMAVVLLCPVPLGTKFLFLLCFLCSTEQEKRRRKFSFLPSQNFFFSFKTFCMDDHDLLWHFSEQGKATPSAASL